MKTGPTLDRERELRELGYRCVAGIDEVGRGCIAGPVFAAAVIMPLDDSIPWLPLVRDSKQLSPRQRQRVFGLVQRSQLPIGIGMASHVEVDEKGIVKATIMAMVAAVGQLPILPDYLLVDALSLPELPLPQRGIVHGDQLSVSIACASIVAKVARDRYMTELDTRYPGYGLACHKGYPTRQHLSCLQQLGISAVHRRSFAPVRGLIEGES